MRALVVSVVNELASWNDKPRSRTESASPTPTNGVGSTHQSPLPTEQNGDKSRIKRQTPNNRHCGRRSLRKVVPPYDSGGKSLNSSTPPVNSRNSALMCSSLRRTRSSASYMTLTIRPTSLPDI
jgi:hypothetical protein